MVSLRNILFNNIETRTGDVGTAKRNILRKGKTGSSNRKSSNINLDDGSLYEDPAALDEFDPNYDSEV